jgi:hypothetical protein
MTNAPNGSSPRGYYGVLAADYRLKKILHFLQFIPSFVLSFLVMSDLYHLSVAAFVCLIRILETLFGLTLCSDVSILGHDP